MTFEEKHIAMQLAAELRRDTRYALEPKVPTYPWIALLVLLVVATVAFLLMLHAEWLTTGPDLEPVRRTARAVVLSSLTIAFASMCIFLREISLARAAYDEARAAEADSMNRAGAVVELLNAERGTP